MIFSARTWALAFLIPVLGCGLMGCANEEVDNYAGLGRPVCAVVCFHDQTPEDLIGVRTDGTFFCEEFPVSPRKSTHLSRYGRLDGQLFSTLQQSIRTDPQWSNSDEEVANFTFDPDNTNTACPASVRELLAFVLSQPGYTPLRAEQIREKIPGTWIKEAAPGDTSPAGIIRFEPDGRFYSSNFLTRAYHETNWETSDEELLLGTNNYSRITFMVNRLDNQELVIQLFAPSLAGPRPPLEKFKKLPPTGSQ